MANETKLYLNFVREGNIQAPAVKKVLLRVNKVLQVKRVIGGVDVVTEYDFSNCPQTDGSISRPDYSDTVYRYQVDADGTVHLWVAVVVPNGTAMPVSDYRESAYSNLASVWKISTETWTIETPSGTQPDWIPTALTDEQKQAQVGAELVNWRNRKKAWLLESPEYADLIPEITKHLGWWLRGADFVISQLWTDKMNDVVTYDWDVTKQIIIEATKGPLTLDPDGDGAYNVLFFNHLATVIGTYPQGPNQRAPLWVNWWELTGSSQPSDVERKNMVTEIFMVNTQLFTERTKAWTDGSTTFDLYNPTNEYWS